MDGHDPEYTLLVGKKHIAVTQVIYKAYYRYRNKETYLDKYTTGVVGCRSPPSVLILQKKKSKRRYPSK